jgi:FixJ family two-component response regulator
VAKFNYQQCRDLPVVVVSGHSDLAERIKNAELGSVVKRIVMKPVDTSALVQFVHNETHCIRESAEANRSS